MRIPLLLAWAVLGGCLSKQGAAAQALVTADSSLRAATRQMQAQYRAALGGQLGLYSGLQYGYFSSPIIQGHPFFGAGTEASTGSVSYDGQTYAAVPLWYDLILDAVVTRRHEGPGQIRLVSERVTGFTLGPRRFVRLPAGTELTPGFYELLYQGPDSLQVLARHSKYLYIVPGDRQGRREYRSREQAFLRRAGRYYAISRLGSVLTALDGHRRELKKLAAARQLSFTADNRAASAAVLAAEYDRLKAPSATAP
ncbi:hypothetical protein EJV47_21760 [Hymenobacter gummosus]|uniref:Uncharacterized protein n=1 Tax=Hymenobacter gummosus TaxID=1776032 RepID=A0A3S0H3J9_9BACT|nr:hypothetical protein [Hymenobacter gummosus]RTQ46578.1 hypothetical protein EJV47_21760 [Hymenobacter gummosus]